MITLQRNQYRPDGIFGAIDEIGVTLEHAFLQSDGTYKPVVPAGIYDCILYDSPKFGFKVYLLQNVPGHDHVEIHVGNFNHDSDGCILLGQTLRDNPEDLSQMITNSEVTFKKFMAMGNGLPIQIQILDA